MNSYFRKNPDYSEPETFRGGNDYVASVEVTTSMEGMFKNVKNTRNSVSLPKQIQQRNHSYMQNYNSSKASAQPSQSLQKSD